MKKTVLLTLISLFIVSCGGGGGTDSETGFAIKPGELTPFSNLVNKSHTITFNGTPYNCTPAAQSCYAIIFSREFNIVTRVGIAVQKETPTEIFNMKIHYPGTIPTSFPSSKNLQSDADSVVIIKITNKNTRVTTTYSYDHGSAFTIDFSSPTDGVYPIATGNSPTIGGFSLTAFSIESASVPY